MKSLLFQESVFSQPPSCSALPCRQEIPINIRKGGRIYRFVLRDKIAPEDPYLIMVKAKAFSIQTGEAYNEKPPQRSVKDFLIKSNLVI